MTSIFDAIRTVEENIVANSRGHVWQKKEGSSEIDWFAMSRGNHNGPKCVLCEYEFCEHCCDAPQIDCPYGTTVANLNPADFYEFEQT